MIDFQPIASSSDGCAYHLSGGGSSAPLLIECGIPFKAIQRATDFNVSGLAGCLISHSHQDHCKSAKDLMKAGVDCYASLETMDAIVLPRGRLEWASWREHRLHPKKDYRDPFDSQWFSVGDWQVTTFEAVHDCDGTLGFIIDSPQKDRLLYLTDSCYSKFVFPGLTRIAIECNHSMELLKANTLSSSIDKSRYSRTAHNHMSLERLLDLLKANDLAKVERITLLHLSDANSDEQEFKLAVERATGIPVDVATKKA